PVWTSPRWSSPNWSRPRPGSPRRLFAGPWRQPGDHNLNPEDHPCRDATPRHSRVRTGLLPFNPSRRFAGQDLGVQPIEWVKVGKGDADRLTPFNCPRPLFWLPFFGQADGFGRSGQGHGGSRALQEFREFVQRDLLDLANALPGQPEPLPNLGEGARTFATQAKAQAQDPDLACFQLVEKAENLTQFLRPKQTTVGHGTPVVRLVFFGGPLLEGVP